MIPTLLAAGLVAGAFRWKPGTARWLAVAGVLLSIAFGFSVGAANGTLTMGFGAFAVALVNFSAGALVSSIIGDVIGRLRRFRSHAKSPVATH